MEQLCKWMSIYEAPQYKVRIRPSRARKDAETIHGRCSNCQAAGHYEYVSERALDARPKNE